MGWSTELGSALGFPSFVISQGYKAGIISQGGDPSAVRAARAQTALAETFWAVQSLSGGSCVMRRCWTTLLWRGCSHSPSQPRGLWFLRSAGSEGRKCTCCSACLPGACRPGPQMWKSMRAPGSTLGAGSSKTGQRTSPGPCWLLLPMQGLYFSSF